MNPIEAKRTRATGLRWAWRAGPLIAAAAAIALLVGCGSSGGTTQSGASSASQKDTSQVRYAQCMRAHGVTNFPDPTGGGAITLSKATIESPQFQTASQACRSLAPSGAPSGGSVSPQVQAQALRFARCMRSHGVPDFPDPSFTGGAAGFAVSGGLGSSPSYSTAGHACRALIPGGGGSITPTSEGGA